MPQLKVPSDFQRPVFQNRAIRSPSACPKPDRRHGLQAWSHADFRHLKHQALEALCPARTRPSRHGPHEFVAASGHPVRCARPACLRTAARSGRFIARRAGSASLAAKEVLGMWLKCGAFSLENGAFRAFPGRARGHVDLLTMALTMLGPRDYKPPGRRGRRCTMVRLRRSSLRCSDEAADSHRLQSVVFGWKMDGSPGWREGFGPGCLTSEVEERETWTAESLRAASSFVRSRPDETSAVERFLGQHHLDVVRRSNAGRLRAALVTDLVSKAARERRLHENVVISRDQISSNLRV